jgi:Ca2+-binding EF-hand superfamily protein
VCINALTQLKNFHCERKLEAAVICYITNCFNTKQNEEKLMKTFKELDKNNDGTLTIDELKEGFFEYMGDKILFEGEL